MNTSYSTALVTGASSGIGKATALALAQRGLAVVAVARRAEALAGLAAAGCAVLPLDVTDHERMAALVEDVAPDVVVNNAGTARMGNLGGSMSGDITDQMAVNVSAVMEILRVAIPIMRAKARGHIVNVSSIAAHHVFPGMPVYAATKAAVAALTDQLRLEVAGTGIRVTEIIPGRVETAIFANALGDAEEARQRFFDGYEALRPEDVAEAIAYAVTAPPHVNLTRLEIMPTHQVPGGLSFHRGGT